MMSSAQHPLIQFLKTLDGVVTPDSPTAADTGQLHVEDDTLDGFEEVNLLEGLMAGMEYHFCIILFTYAPQGPRSQRRPILTFLQRVWELYPAESYSPSHPLISLPQLLPLLLCPLHPERNQLFESRFGKRSKQCLAFVSE